MSKRFKYKVPVETKAGVIQMKGGPLMIGTDEKKKFKDWLEWREYLTDKAEADKKKADLGRSGKGLKKGLREGLESIEGKKKRLREDEKRRLKIKKYGT